ncbi:type II toxin-antitoxin system Phd/YefM family antitoxin [Moraxella catarrhalis]|uniref:type II toxin-antitoxin system Phd/YefM family antitoxin n=1 Tax=Moraxella catarrhalis TaxID=480 RepID=UPI0007E3CCF8|nr:type II toxin-antitoxin system Phd/YefM family antitoxin [Moraxella catarrhalis]OAV29474.1 RelB/StbD replicon stabilization protein antitoxin to RelE/StbE [Moraxella catarrhalis]
MLNTIYSKYIASISEFKKSPMDVLKNANGETVAVLNRNEPAFYCVPAARYADLIDLIEDLELAQIAEERKNEPRIWVNIDEL